MIAKKKSHDAPMGLNLYFQVLSAARWRWRPLARNGAITTAAPSLSADTSSRGPR